MSSVDVVIVTGVPSVVTSVVLSLSLVLFTFAVTTVFVSFSRIAVVTTLSTESLELLSITSLVVDPSLYV